MDKAEFMKIWWAQNQSEPVPPDNEVWYWAPEKVTLYSTTGVVEHTFANGKGVLKFASAVTAVNTWLRGTAITDVRLPETVTSIGGSAFNGCTSLALTELPSGVTSIGTYAFQNCSSLALTELPETVTSIGDRAFYGCTSLALTSLPSGVTSIGNNAFYGCTRLALTELPSGVTSIGNSAFSGCTSIALTELPSGLTSIGTYAFNACTSLALTSLPSGLTSIGDRAFQNCWKTIPHTLTFLGTPTSIASNAFNNNPKLTDIYVPWAEGEVANAPWGATAATIHYNHIP